MTTVGVGLVFSALVFSASVRLMGVSDSWPVALVSAHFPEVGQNWWTGGMVTLEAAVALGASCPRTRRMSFLVIMVWNCTFFLIALALETVEIAVFSLGGGGAPSAPPVLKCLPAVVTAAAALPTLLRRGRLGAAFGLVVVFGALGSGCASSASQLLLEGRDGQLSRSPIRVIRADDFGAIVAATDSEPPSIPFSCIGAPVTLEEGPFRQGLVTSYLGQDGREALLSVSPLSLLENRARRDSVGEAKAVNGIASLRAGDWVCVGRWVVLESDSASRAVAVNGAVGVVSFVEGTTVGFGFDQWAWAYPASGRCDLFLSRARLVGVGDSAYRELLWEPGEIIGAVSYVAPPVGVGALGRRPKAITLTISAANAAGERTRWQRLSIAIDGVQTATGIADAAVRFVMYADCIYRRPMTVALKARATGNEWRDIVRIEKSPIPTSVQIRTEVGGKLKELSFMPGEEVELRLDLG